MDDVASFSGLKLISLNPYILTLFSRQIAQLSTKNPAYKKFALDLLELLFHADIGSGDITTALVKNPQQKAQAVVKTKQSGVLAGLDEAELFWQRHGVKILARKKDGVRIKAGDIVVRLSGSAKNILTTERIALNLIQRMSGIATASDKLAAKIGKRKFAATRKTPYSLLDSRAVVLGYGLPHRLSLADQVLVKDNHLKIDPACWKNVRGKDCFEIEADSEKLALEIVNHFAKAKNLILLLDNFTPAQLKKIAPKLRKINSKIILEASGGITPKNAKLYIAAGVNYVSLGSLTHSVSALDLSLKIKGL